MPFLLVADRRSGIQHDRVHRTDAALAATYAQDAAVRVVYETHQFHGAIGLTLEYPLHYWTNRLRRLQGELGGASQQGSRAAQALWAA